MVNARWIFCLLLLSYDSAKAQQKSFLDLARSLEIPNVTATKNGETENLDFWQTNEKLLQQAWREWENEQQEKLPYLNEKTVMDSYLQESIIALWNSPTAYKEEIMKKHFWNESIPGVYTCRQFFSPTGIERIRRHLKAATSSGIPTRRPNGMNRYGLVLDKESEGGISYKEIDFFREWLVDDYVRPLGRMLFPEYIGPMDDVLSYAFTIHYKEESANTTASNKTTSKGDVLLNEHTDASVVTMNINLNLPQKEAYEGSELVFLDVKTKSRNKIELQPGMVVFHRGLHPHQALPIKTGERHQLIVWLFGRDGYVRVAPYDKHERMNVEQRWSKPETESRNAHKILEL